MLQSGQSPCITPPPAAIGAARIGVATASISARIPTATARRLMIDVRTTRGYRTAAGSSTPRRPASLFGAGLAGPLCGTRTLHMIRFVPPGREQLVEIGDGAGKAVVERDPRLPA